MPRSRAASRPSRKTSRSSPSSSSTRRRKEMRVLAIPGSLRNDSYNAKLLYNAVELFPEDAVLDLWGGLKDVPPYDEDDDNGMDAPAAVAELRDAIARADTVLIATPEYNHSIPGQL